MAENSPALLKQKPPAWVNAHEILTLLPAEKHHFNLEAPQQCGTGDFLEKSARRLRCQLHEAGEQTVKVAVCDDAKTFCRFESYKVEIREVRSWKGKKIKDQKSVYLPQSQRHALPGFIDNQPDQAQAEAKKRGQLLFIDFYGIWCPPCNLLDEKVYPLAEFQNATEDMIRVSLDADSDLSWKWKDHFHVRGYPTVIIANSELQEISRMVGYKDIRAVLQWIKESRVLKDSPIDWLAGKSSPMTVAEKIRVSRWYYERGEYESCRHNAQDLKPSSEGHLLSLKCSLALAQQQDGSPQVQKLLRQMIRSYPKDIEMPGWLIELRESQDPFANEQRLKAALKSLIQWRDSVELSASGYTRHDLFGTEAALLEAYQKKTEAQQRYALAAEAVATEVQGKQPEQLKKNRGLSLDWAYYLYKSGKIEEARQLYQAMIDLFPQEFTFHYNYAYVLNELGLRDEALTHVKKAESQAYGDNWLRASALWAKIELARNQPAAAKWVLEKTLSEAVIPASSQVRTHRYIATLRELYQKSQAAQN